MRMYLVLALGLTASAGLAQTSEAPAAGEPASLLDPNERICQRVQVLGSRLNNQRVCLTRAQWEQRRQTDRRDAERAQTNRIVPR